MVVEFGCLCNCFLYFATKAYFGITQYNNNHKANATTYSIANNRMLLSSLVSRGGGGVGGNQWGHMSPGVLHTAERYYRCTDCPIVI